jgi:hypothetical protein
MSNITIVSSSIDIVKVLFEALLPTLPDHTDDACAVLSDIDDQISYEQHERLYSAMLAAVEEAQAAAFRAGWEMRGSL